MTKQTQATKKMDFEEFLEEKHAEDYHGLDDDMPDAFDTWLTELEGEDYIKYGNEFAEHARAEERRHVVKRVKTFAAISRFDGIRYFSVREDTLQEITNN